MRGLEPALIAAGRERHQLPAPARRRCRRQRDRDLSGVAPARAWGCLGGACRCSPAGAGVPRSVRARRRHHGGSVDRRLAHASTDARRRAGAVAAATGCRRGRSAGTLGLTCGDGEFNLLALCSACRRGHARLAHNQRSHEENRMSTSLTINGKSGDGERRARHAAAVGGPRRARPDRHQVRLRHGAVRRLHRAPRRRSRCARARRRSRRVAGKKVTTIEGLSARRDRSRCSGLDRSSDVPQCGYCQSGQIMTRRGAAGEERRSPPTRTSTRR